MTRVELAARIQNFFNNPTYFTDYDINNSIQDGIDEVCAFTGCIYKSAVVPFVGGLSYYDMLTILPDYIGMIAVYNSTINRWMWPMSLRKFDELRIDWECVLGVPYYFSVVNHRYMAIYQKPATSLGNMLVYYRAAAPTLDDSTQIPLLDDYLNTLENYNITDLFEQSQEWQKAGGHFESYVKDLQQLKNLIQSKRMPDRLPSLR